MIASSSTFRPPSAEGHRGLFRMLRALLHGTEALDYNNDPRGTATSTRLAIIFGRILVQPFNSGATAALVSVLALPAEQALMLAVIALKQPAIMCFTWDEWSYPYLFLLWGLSAPMMAESLLSKKISLWNSGHAWE